MGSFSYHHFASERILIFSGQLNFGPVSIHMAHREQVTSGFLTGDTNFGNITISNTIGYLDISDIMYKQDLPLVRWIGYERNDNGIITRDKKLQYGKRPSISADIIWEDVPVFEE